jgi:hypothetical protein
MMRLALLLSLVGCVRSPAAPLSNAASEPRAAVADLGELSVSLPPGVSLRRTRSLLLWFDEEVETGTIEMAPPRVATRLSIQLYPIPATSDLDKLAKMTARRVLARRVTSMGPEVTAVDELATRSRATSILVHRRDLGLVCDVTAADGKTLAVGTFVCASLSR